MQITYVVVAEPEDDHPRGHFASGNDADDDAMVADILRRLERGDVWAWCYVRVIATVSVDGQTFRGENGLGACSYKNEAEFCAEIGYYDDMVQAAYDDLMSSVDAAVRRGDIARLLAPRLDAVKPVHRTVPS